MSPCPKPETFWADLNTARTAPGESNVHTKRNEKWGIQAPPGSPTLCAPLTWLRAFEFDLSLTAMKMPLFELPLHLGLPKQAKAYFVPLISFSLTPKAQIGEVILLGLWRTSWVAGGTNSSIAVAIALSGSWATISNKTALVRCLTARMRNDRCNAGR